MKNLIFILIFLLGFLSNNTVFAVANKATYSETQTIHNIPKQKKLSYLEKVFTKKIEKIGNNKVEFREIISTVVRFISFVSICLTFICLILLAIWLLTLGSLGINIWLILGGIGLFAGITILTAFITTVILGESLFGSC